MRVSITSLSATGFGVLGSMQSNTSTWYTSKGVDAALSRLRKLCMEEHRRTTSPVTDIAYLAQVRGFFTTGIGACALVGLQSCRGHRLASVVYCDARGDCQRPSVWFEVRARELEALLPFVAWLASDLPVTEMSDLAVPMHPVAWVDTDRRVTVCSAAIPRSSLRYSGLEIQTADLIKFLRGDKGFVQTASSASATH